MPNRTELYTLLALCIFILSFFPGIFHSLWTVPLSILTTPLSVPPTSSPAPPATMSWAQTTFSLPSRARGSYLITDEVVKAVPQIKEYKIGILHLFVQHTSCGIAMNENWDDDVRADMSDALDRIVPMDKSGKMYRHNAEGDDDMPAHVKSALVGSSVTIPISNGRLNTGTWQGIWLLEFRTSRHKRNLVATIQGEKMK